MSLHRPCRLALVVCRAGVAGCARSTPPESPAPEAATAPAVASKRLAAPTADTSHNPGRIPVATQVGDRRRGPVARRVLPGTGQAHGRGVRRRPARRDRRLQSHQRGLPVARHDATAAQPGNVDDDGLSPAARRRRCCIRQVHDRHPDGRSHR